MKRLVKLLIVVYLMAAVIWPSFGIIRRQGEIQYELRSLNETDAFERYQALKNDESQIWLVKYSKGEEKIEDINVVLPEGFVLDWHGSGGTDNKGFMKVALKTPAKPGEYLITMEGRSLSGDSTSVNMLVNIIDEGKFENDIRKLRDNKFLISGESLYFPTEFASDASLANKALFAEFVLGTCLLLNGNDPASSSMGSILLIGMGPLFIYQAYIADELNKIFDAGWVNWHDVAASSNNVLYFEDTVNAVERPGSNKVQGVIRAGEFRRASEEKYFNGEMWYMIGIHDRWESKVNKKEEKDYLMILKENSVSPEAMVERIRLKEHQQNEK